MITNINPLYTRYCVYLHLKKEINIDIGRLGKYTFPAGTYVYIGSAKRSLQKRLERHLRIDKPLRWHFDYLRPYGDVTKIITYENIEECALLEKARLEQNGSYIVKGFGSSDCKCYSHLLYLDTRN